QCCNSSLQSLNLAKLNGICVDHQDGPIQTLIPMFYDFSLDDRHSTCKSCFSVISSCSDNMFHRPQFTAKMCRVCSGQVWCVLTSVFKIRGWLPVSLCLKGRITSGLYSGDPPVNLRFSNA